MRFPQIAQLLLNAPTTSPRGFKTKEIRNFGFIVDEIYMTYECRNFNLDYLKAEARWYLSGDPYNAEIEEYARIWGQIKQSDGRYFSNYGQYWFGTQDGYAWVMNSLVKDPDSRQAFIPMLSKEHLFLENKDVVCTCGINFHIRDNKVHMTVIMRSSDFILGYAYDLPMFNMLHEIVVAGLNKVHGLPVTKGEYYHMSMSLHVYEKHWSMLEKIATNEGKYKIYVPEIDDSYDLILGRYQSEFGRWLNE